MSDKTKNNGLKMKAITRRDYFASAALQALIQNTHPAQSAIDQLSEKAYHFADAMIEASASTEEAD